VIDFGSRTASVRHTLGAIINAEVYMKNLTRYAYVHDEQDGVCFCRIVESEHGEWVKFSDIEEALTTAPNNARDEILRHCGTCSCDCTGHPNCTSCISFSNWQRKTSPIA
jgi:hypothetical protein